MSSGWLLPGATRDRQSVTRDWEPACRELIEGVRVSEVRHVPKGSGALTEVFRRDWFAEEEHVAQVFQVRLVPGAVSAWHAHERATDRLFVTSGMARLVLYDHRESSPTFGRVNELLIGEYRPVLVIVPPQVWHGVQAISETPALILNLPDRAYDYEAPDHWRVSQASATVPFDFPAVTFPARG